MATTKAPPCIRRDVSPGELATIRRAVLGVPPEIPAPGELAASVRRPLPKRVRGLDAGAWIAWCLAGLRLFGSEPLPIRRTGAEAKRLAVVLAMLRCDGNISVAARALQTSRRSLRENLRAMGLYPWRTEPEAERDDSLEGPDDAC